MYLTNMDIPKYDGNIHPDEWIKDIHTYFNHSGQLEASVRSLMTAKSLVDSTIKLPTGIGSLEQLRNALKEGMVRNPETQNPDRPKSRNSKSRNPKSRQVQNPNRVKIPTSQNPDRVKIPTGQNPDR